MRMYEIHLSDGNIEMVYAPNVAEAIRRLRVQVKTGIREIWDVTDPVNPEKLKRQHEH